MKNIINVSGQMELGLNGLPVGERPAKRQSRTERAAWWFGKMRAAVDTAIAWSARTSPPPQQIWLAGTR